MRWIPLVVCLVGCSYPTTNVVEEVAPVLDAGSPAPTPDASPLDAAKSSPTSPEAAVYVCPVDPGNRPVCTSTIECTSACGTTAEDCEQNCALHGEGTCGCDEAGAACEAQCAPACAACAATYECDAGC